MNVSHKNDAQTFPSEKEKFRLLRRVVSDSAGDPVTPEEAVDNHKPLLTDFDQFKAASRSLYVRSYIERENHWLVLQSLRNNPISLMEVMVTSLFVYRSLFRSPELQWPECLFLLRCLAFSRAMRE